MASKKQDDNLVLKRYVFRVHRYTKHAEPATQSIPREMVIEEFNEHEARRAVIELYHARNQFVRKLELIKFKPLF